MKHKAIIIQVAALMALGAATASAQNQSTPSDIPLAAIYATFNQPGLQRAQNGPMVMVEPGMARPFIMGFAWAIDFDELTKTKFLAVPADDGQPAFTRPANAEAQLWAGAYFGSTGSSPPQFLIDSVKVQPTGIVEIQYHKAPPGISTRDLRPYMAWIPLGKLSTGNYTLRLLEAAGLRTEQKWTVTSPPSKTQTGISTNSVFGITLRKAQDKIDVQDANGTTSFAVASPSGIGGAVIRMRPSGWPANVLVRLRYDAQRPFERLEGFSAVAEGGARFDEIRGRPTEHGMEVELPTRLLQSNPASIELSWVDMYR